MYVIRPAQLKDLNAIVALSKTGDIGITSLPATLEGAWQRLQAAVKAIKTSTKDPGHQNYLFLLEDTESQKVVGCCGIHANTSYFDNYSYKIETVLLPQTLPNAISTTRLLHFTSGYPLSSEICTLYLDPQVRKGGFGKLLSLSRFLFIANHQERFAKRILASMRGVIEPSGRAPFWEGIARHFLDVSYEEFLKIILNQRELIPSIVPKYPLYISLLPVEVQQVIGKVHHHTFAALNMLLHEGFGFTDHIDPFDGGPVIFAETKNIKTIKDSQEYVVAALTEDEIDSPLYIIANVNLDFRACYGSALIDQAQAQAVIAKKVAKVLNVDLGDPIRLIEAP